MSDEMQLSTEELARWLDKKYSRHGEIEDGLAAEKLRSQQEENTEKDDLLWAWLQMHIRGESPDDQHIADTRVAIADNLKGE